MFLNEVRNHAFGVWLGGAPTQYSTQLTNTTLQQLNHTDLRGHPNRVATETYGLGSLGQGYVYERPSSLRATIAAAGAVDAFRIWPWSTEATNIFTVAHLGPFLVVAGVNDTILFDEGGATMTATLTAGSYSAATLAVEIAAAVTVPPPGATNPTVDWDQIARHFIIRSAAGVFNIDWLAGPSLAAGLLGYTADDTLLTTYISDVATPAGLNCLYRAFEGKKHAFSVAARCQTPGNLLRVRIVGLDGDYAITSYLNAQGRWQAAAAWNTFQLSGMWRRYGLTFEAPPTVRYFLWQVSNGTAGAQLLDLGNVWWQNPMWQLGQEEARV